MRESSLFDRVLAEMAACKRVSVKPLYTPRGIFVNAKLAEQAEFFVSRRATRKQGKRK